MVRAGLVIDELAEWFEDVAGDDGWEGVGSRCVVVAVPKRWGRTTLLDALASRVEASGLCAVTCRLVGTSALSGLALQTVELADVLGDKAAPNPAARALGIDTGRGALDSALSATDVLGLLGGRIGSVAALLGGWGLEAWVGRDSGERARHLAEADRLGRRLARYSREAATVALLIDDAERLDTELLDRLVTAMLTVRASRVLIVLVAEPRSAVTERLLRADLVGGAPDRIHRLDVDAGMDADQRFDLVRELAPQWPIAAADRLAQRTMSFAEVYEVMAAGAAHDLPASDQPLAAVDALLDATHRLPAPSIAAMIVAWSGGLLHNDAVDDISQLLEIDSAAADVVRAVPLVRLADSGTCAHLSDLARHHLSGSDRSRIAVRIADVARSRLNEVDDPLERVALLHPVSVLVDMDMLLVDNTITELLIVLATTRQQIGDTGEAGRIAESVKAHSEAQSEPVAAEILRLLTEVGGSIHVAKLPPECILGTEARVYHAAALLRATPTDVAAAEALRAELDALGDSTIVNRWRLLLAHSLARGGHLAAAADFLAPLLDADSRPPEAEIAELILYDAQVVGENALQRLILIQRLDGLPANALPEDRLGLLDAIADLSDRLGDFRAALRYGTALLTALAEILAAQEPALLKSRHRVAFWTGECGDASTALRLFEDLLPDEVRVLGADHSDVLTTRHNIAYFTGDAGDREEALRLFEELLPDRVRVLGADHPDVLATRMNVATCTGLCGDGEEALRLLKDLLPDLARVLGADHPNVLTTRSNIATYTGNRGHATEALRLFTELLPDLVRVLGADHPNVLLIRSNIAFWTGKCGGAEPAARLLKQLLPDMERVMGAHNPNVRLIREAASALESQIVRQN